MTTCHSGPVLLLCSYCRLLCFNRPAVSHRAALSSSIELSRILDRPHRTSIGQPNPPRGVGSQIGLSKHPSDINYMFFNSFQLIKYCRLNYREYHCIEVTSNPKGERMSDLDRCKKYLRSVLLASKCGIPVKQVSREYSHLYEEDIPFRKLNFPSLGEERIIICNDFTKH